MVLCDDVVMYLHVSLDYFGSYKAENVFMSHVGYLEVGREGGERKE